MQSSPRNKKSKLPNILTIFRLACIPLVLIFLHSPEKLPSFLAALFFALAAITDMLDGFLARKYESVTVLGKFLDPLADKILVSVTMIMLIPLGRIPVWMVIIIIARELAVTGLRGIAANERIVIQATALGKHKTTFQVVALVGLCLHHTYFSVNTHAVGMAFLCLALILTVWSGWDYFRQFKRVLSEANR